MIDRVVVAISIRTSIEADIRTLIVKFPPGHQAKEAFLSAILTLGVPVSLRRGTRAAAAIPTRTLGHPVPSQSWLHGRWGGGVRAPLLSSSSDSRDDDGGLLPRGSSLQPALPVVVRPTARALVALSSK